MKFQEFLNDHWNVFCAHISHYHPISFDFIQKFRYDLNWRELRNNINVKWNDSLLNIIPLEFHFFKYSDTYTQYGRNQKNSSFLEPEKLKNLRETLELQGKLIKVYRNLYNDYILKHLQGKDIAEIFYKYLNYDQKYFALKPLDGDAIGNLMSFSPYTYEFLEPYDKNNNKRKLKLIEEDNNIGEGIPRIYQIAKTNPYSKSLIISENVKKILENLNIANHHFIPLESSIVALQTNLKYFLLTIEVNSLLKLQDFANTRFYYYARRDKKYRKFWIEKGLIKNIDDIVRYKKENKILSSEIYPEKFELKTDLDIFSFRNDIIITERVKNLLDFYLNGQMMYKSVQLLNINSNVVKNFDLLDEKKHVLVEAQNIVDGEIKFYFDKMDRIKSEKPELDKQIDDDEFSEIQIKLNVIIPQSVKEKYRYLKTKERPHHDLSYEEYEKLDKEGIKLMDDGLELVKEDRFYFIPEYDSFNPKAHKAIAIGSLGNGDEIGLMLEKNEDCLLQEILYFFSHEDGDIFPYIDEFNHFRLTVPKPKVNQTQTEEKLEPKESKADTSSEMGSSDSVINKKNQPKAWWRFWE